MCILALESLVRGLGIHLIADPHKGAHCMQQQTMILKKMKRMKTNASQRLGILGSQEVRQINTKESLSLFYLKHYTIYLLYFVLYGW